MSDLVQRLHTFWPNGFDQGDVPQICEEAADRIEALEAALREIAELPRTDMAYSHVKLLQEIARCALEGKP